MWKGCCLTSSQPELSYLVIKSITAVTALCNLPFFFPAFKEILAYDFRVTWVATFCRLSDSAEAHSWLVCKGFVVLGTCLQRHMCLAICKECVCVCILTNGFSYFHECICCMFLSIQKHATYVLHAVSVHICTAATNALLVLF